MVTWFGILILVFAILLIVVVAIDIYYANRIREGGTFSSGGSAAVMWLNFFALLFLIAMIILAIWYLVARPREIRLCKVSETQEGKTRLVTTTDKGAVSVVHQVPPSSETSFVTSPSGSAQVTRLEEATY